MQQHPEQPQQEQDQPAADLPALLLGLRAHVDQGPAHAFVTDRIEGLFRRHPTDKAARRRWIWQVAAQIYTSTFDLPFGHRDAQVSGFIQAASQVSDRVDAGAGVSPLDEVEVWLDVTSDIAAYMSEQLRHHARAAQDRP